MSFEAINIQNETIKHSLRECKSGLQFADKVNFFLKTDAEFAKKCNGIDKFASMFATKELSKHTFIRSLDTIINNDYLKFAHLVLDLHGDKLSKTSFFSFAENSIAPTIWNSIYHNNLNKVSDYLDFVKEPLNKDDFYNRSQFYHIYHGKSAILADSTTAGYAISTGNYHQIETTLNSHGEQTNKQDLLSKTIEHELNMFFNDNSYLVTLANKEPALLKHIMINSKSQLSAKEIENDFKIAKSEASPAFKTIILSNYFFDSPDNLIKLWKASSNDVHKDYRNVNAFNTAVYKLKIKHDNIDTYGKRSKNIRQNKTSSLIKFNINKFTR